MLVTHAQETRSTVFIFLYPVQNCTIKLTPPQLYIRRKRLYLSESLYSSSEDLCMNCSLKTGTDKNQPTTHTHSLGMSPADHKHIGTCSFSGNAHNLSSNPKQTLKYCKPLCRLSNSLNCDHHCGYLST